VWTGFHYAALVERSHKKLHQLWDSGTLFHDLLKEVIDHGVYNATLTDVAEAVQEIDDSLSKVINSQGHFSQRDESDFPSFWEPLVVDGEVVLGAKVYKGQSKAIDKGSIYIDGVKLGEKVLEAAPKWPVNSKPKTVLKDILRAKLPVGLYVRYSLSRDDVTILIGDEAVTAAKTAGVLIDPSAIRSLFKIAS
jgi:hypothetical protein